MGIGCEAMCSYNFFQCNQGCPSHNAIRTLETTTTIKTEFISPSGLCLYLYYSVFSRSIFHLRNFCTHAEKNKLGEVQLDFNSV